MCEMGADTGGMSEPSCEPVFVDWAVAAAHTPAEAIVGLPGSGKPFQGQTGTLGK